MLTKCKINANIKSMEVNFMKTYFFSVIFGNFYHGYHIQAKTLSKALNLLESQIMKDSFHYRGLVEWTVCTGYTIYSASGKRSHRSLSQIIRGVA